MSVWIAQPKLESGEVGRWKSSANRVLGSWGTAGGKLMVTDRRILFQPNRFDMAIGRKSWSCPLDVVGGVEAVDRDGAVGAGGLRKRLGIRTADGLEIFVVNGLEEKVAELREILTDRSH